MKMTKKMKNVNKIIITSRLTGTLAVTTLVSTANLVPKPPENDTHSSILEVYSNYFNIVQVAERVLDTDLDGDGEVGADSAKPDHSGSVTRPNRRPVASNRPSLSNKPGSSNKPQPLDGDGEVGADSAKPDHSGSVTRPNRRPVASNRPSLSNKPGSSNKPQPGLGNKPGSSNKPSSGKPGTNNGKPGANAPGSGSSVKPDNKPSGNKPSGDKPSGNKPSGNKPSNGGNALESIKMELLNERDVLDVAAKPMTKEAALRNIKPYKFTLKNSGTVNFDANIKLNIKENSLKVNNRDVRVYVTDNYGNVVMDGTFDQLLSKDIRISRFMDRSFNLWAWLDKPTSVKDGKFEFVGNVVMDGTFDQLLSKDIRISRFMDRSFNLWAWLDKPTSVKDGKFEFVMSALATQSMERGSN